MLNAPNLTQLAEVVDGLLSDVRMAANEVKAREIAIENGNAIRGAQYLDACRALEESLTCLLDALDELSAEKLTTLENETKELLEVLAGVIHNTEYGMTEEVEGAGEDDELEGYH